MKLVQIEFVNSDGRPVTTVWSGNEYAKDASEVLLLVAQSYENNCIITDHNVYVKCEEPENHFLNDRIQRIMRKAGYEWIVPKTITLK